MTRLLFVVVLYLCWFVVVSVVAVFAVAFVVASVVVVVFVFEFLVSVVARVIGAKVTMVLLVVLKTTSFAHAQNLQYPGRALWILEFFDAAG